VAVVVALPASIRLIRRNSNASVSVAVTTVLAVATEMELHPLSLHPPVNPLHIRLNLTRSESALESSSPRTANHSAGDFVNL
jgi:hypothetical protein